MAGAGKAVQRVLLETQGSIAILRMTRKDNRLNNEFIEQFNEAMDTAERLVLAIRDVVIYPCFTFQG